MIDVWSKLCLRCPLKTICEIMSAPSHLYKYESFSVQSLENLNNRVIYFGSPAKFNDPYDCALYPTIATPSDEDVEKIRSHYIEEPDCPEQARQAFERHSVIELRNLFLRQGEAALQTQIDKFLLSNGVSCFAEKPDNLLMWSHYADKQRGFCLEFSTCTEPFKKITQVEYSKDMPAFSLVSMLCENDFEQIMKLFCTKSVDWQYEREWRAFHAEAGTRYFYPATALTGLYFGPEASTALIEIIACVLKAQSENVKLWRGSRSKTKFSVDFEQVTYKSA